MSSKLPKAILTEQNPIRPSVDPQVVASPKGLKSFLDDQADTLNREAEKNAGGDTSLSWELLTQTEKEQRYTLGSIGRFYHPDFGMIQARYVMFDELVGGDDVGFPVGMLVSQGNPWIVTNDLSQSHANLLCGIAAPYDFFESGSFGWVITDGVIIQSLELSTDIGLGQAVTWTENGKVGFVPGYARTAGQSLFSGSGEIPAAKLLVALSTPGNPGNVINTTTYDDSELQAALGNLQDKLSNVEFGVGLVQRQFNRMTPDEISVAYQSALSLAINWAKVAETAASNALGAQSNISVDLQATASFRQEVSSMRSDTEVLVRSASILRNEASAFNSASGASASASAVFATNAAVSASDSAGFAASASISATVSASIGPGLLNKNPQFSIWTIPAALPDYWGSIGNLTTIQSVGKTSPYAVDIYGPTSSGANAFIYADTGSNPGLNNLKNGSYVLELDIGRATGSFADFTMRVIGIDAGGSTVETKDLVPSTDVDTTGVTPGTGPSTGIIFRYRKLVKFTNTSIVRFSIYLGWMVPGPTGRGVSVQRCGIRPASKAEVDGNQALSDAGALDTRVTVTESSIVGIDTRTGALEGQYGVEITAGNRITGFKLLGSATRSDAIFQVDKFKVWNGVSAEVPFLIDGGVVYINIAKIKDADIGTLKVAGDAITRTVAAFTSGTDTVPSGGGVDGQFLNLTTRGGPTKININFFAYWKHTTDPDGATYRLIRQNASTLAATVILGPVALDSDWDATTGEPATHRGSVSFEFVDNPTAGSWNYYYQIMQTGCAYCSIYYRALSVTEFLR